MGDSLRWTCHVCGNVGFDDGSTDGFFYFISCGAQAEDIVDTGVADEDFVDNGGESRGAIYLANNRRNAIKAEPISQVEPSHQLQSQFWEALKTLGGCDDPNPQHVKNEDEKFLDGVGPTGPTDFGSGFGSLGQPSFDDYHSELRMTYVMGIQLMIQMQCKALVEIFKVSPLICGLSGTIWLRFVASTRVFDDGWADEAIHDSELQKQGD